MRVFVLVFVMERWRCGVAAKLRWWKRTEGIEHSPLE
jgi:hypothetical protein